MNDDYILAEKIRGMVLHKYWYIDILEKSKTYANREGSTQWKNKWLEIGLIMKEVVDEHK
jgi:hypothetical protein